MAYTGEQIRAAKKIARLRMAAMSFWEYCKLKDPKFYKDDRPYLKELCDNLQSFAEQSEAALLIIACPPRTGKSYTLQHFTQWLLGNDPSTKIITASYNETLSTQFAKEVRNAIMERKADEDRVVFSDIFPEVRIKAGDAAMNLWSLEGHYANYLATSPTGTATGFGAKYILIDDLIKNSMEAFNERVKEEHYNWFATTMRSRLEEGGKIIICATRWAATDLSGRAKALYDNMGWPYKEVLYKAENADGSTICEEILSKKSLEQIKHIVGEEIFMANYQQTPIDAKGRLYTTIKIYDDIPRDGGGHPLFTAYKAYVDTADTGKDYLSAIAYAVSFDHNFYILDMVFSQEPMEKTEVQVAEMLKRNNIRVADIESNNGGRGFARNVDRLLKDKYNYFGCSIKWFTQHQNKVAKILTNAPNVMEHILFPKDWTFKWPEFAQQVLSYQKEGKNAHDDGPDSLSEIILKNEYAPLRINKAILHDRY